MSLPPWRVAIIFLALLQTSAFADTPRTLNDFVGRWAFRVGGRELMILQLQPSPNGRGLIGDFTRPQHFRIDVSGRDASAVSGPVISDPVLTAKVEGEVLSLTVRDAADPEHPTTFDFNRTGKDSGELAYAGLAMRPMPMARVGQEAHVALDWDPAHFYEANETRVDNPDMTRIYDADQSDRQSPAAIDWAAVAKADAARRASTSQLLQGGKLHTGADFEHAAFVFQHGTTGNDYLLAHTLALAAMRKVDGAAAWIAAATLDRYLQSAGQPQIYGTQSRGKPGETTQEPYDRNLISDELRLDLGVKQQADQQGDVEASDAGAHKP